MRYTIILFLFLVGCSSLPEYCGGHPNVTECTTLVRQHRTGVDAENWIQCNRIRGVIVHMEHTGHELRNERNKLPPGGAATKRDLVYNQCIKRLGTYWRPYDY